VLEDWKEPNKEWLFEDFRYNRQETDWPIGGEGMGGFLRF
jgi:hypothetical protein